MSQVDFDHSTVWLPRLSPRQAEVLRWTAEGKTSWEISVIMECTEATVNYHLKQLFLKLDAANKTHAVSKAFMFGLLPHKDVGLPRREVGRAELDAEEIEDSESELEMTPSLLVTA